MFSSSALSSVLDFSQKEYEEKFLTREGENSLITYPNPSCFSVYSYIRHFVQQQQLCDTYNLRYRQSSDGESSEEEEEEKSEKSKEQNKLPEVDQ